MQHVDGPLLVLAGPGSGKTRVVTHRIAWMLRQGVDGRNILALTFTNKAASEMRLRVESLAPHGYVWLGTFHSFAARLLRQYGSLVGLEANYTIYDADDAKRMLARSVDRLKLDLMHHNMGQLASAISWAKNNLIAPEEYTPRPGVAIGQLVRRAYPAYEEGLRRANAADFDDLLTLTARLLRDHPEVRAELDARYRYILVDEYQDTNLAQYAIARAMSIDHPNLAATGDPDQSIYGWRGANLRNILDFEQDFPEVKVVRLERNYRSTPNILSVASRLIAHNVRRKQKALFTDNVGGKRVRLVNYSDHKEEARDIARRIAEAVRSGKRKAGDFAVFYRINALSRVFEFAFREEGVPFQLVHALEFYQRKEIKDLRAYLQLINNPSDDAAFSRIINTPRRGIGRTTLDRVTAHADRRAIPLLEAAGQAHAVDGLSKRSAKLVATFADLMTRLTQSIDRPVEEILGLVLAETSYAKAFEDSEDEEDLQRLANIQELLTVAREFDERYAGARALEGFLEETALASDLDDWEGERDCVTVMTLHASKGLEFPCVFIAAVEDGLLPHERSKEKEDQLEEERRLLFVGITRAEEELQLSKAGYRDFRGQRKITIPSRFLMELPREEMETVDLDPFAISAPLPSRLADDDWADQSVDDDEFEETFHVEKDDEAEVPPEPLDEPTTSPTKPRRAKRPTGLAGIAGLQTAAEMNGDAGETVDPDAYRRGMIVMHGEHGIGVIAALSGSGAQREAVVDFQATGARVRVVIAEGMLKPLSKG